MESFPSYYRPMPAILTKFETQRAEPQTKDQVDCRNDLAITALLQLI